NDSDPEGTQLTVTVVSAPEHGSATIDPGGTITYTPDAGYSGPDRFTYNIRDGAGLTATASVVVTVVAPNDPPIANGDSYAATTGVALVIGAPGVLGNDIDPEGQPLDARLVSRPAHGTLALARDGSFVYTSEAGYRGQDFFTYQANDAVSDSNVTT